MRVSIDLDTGLNDQRCIKKRSERDKWLVCVQERWQHNSSTRLAYHRDYGSRSRLITVIHAACEKSIDKFKSTKHRRFFPGTLASSCSNTGLMRGGPYWTSMESR